MPQGKVELFPLPERTPYADEASFRSGLVRSGLLEQILDQNNLYAVVSLMGFQDPNRLRELLRKNRFTIVEELGSVWEIQREPDNRDTSELAAYVACDWSEGIAVYYTNYPKTAEIDKHLLPYISRTSTDMDLFVMYPALIQRILDGLFKEFPSGHLIEFTAHSTRSTDAGTVHRSGYSRTVRYWGDDGKTTYPELNSLYGVAITSALVELPESSTKFRLHQKGTVGLIRGNPTLLSQILDQYLLPEARRQRAAVVRARRLLMETGTSRKTVRIPVVFPMRIQLASPLPYYETNRDLPELLAKHRFPVISFYAEEGSLFLNASLVDKDSKSYFEIRANQRQIRLLPGSRTRLSTLLRFYDFVLEEIDPYATLQI